MDNNTEIAEETVQAPTEPVPDAPVEQVAVPDAPDAPAPAKPKNNKGILIGIVAIAIVAILLIAFMLMAEPGVEGKWIPEKSEIMNPDGSVNSTHVVPADSEEWMEIRSDGTIIYGNSTETHDYNVSITWEYTNDGQIEMTMYYNPSVNGWNNVTLTQESQIYEYEIDGDTLTLGFLTPNSGVTLRMTYTKA